MFCHPSVSHSVNRGCLPLGSGVYTPWADTPWEDTSLEAHPQKDTLPEAHPPETHPPGSTPQDGHCSGQYVSYWNAFLS